MMDIDRDDERDVLEEIRSKERSTRKDLAKKKRLQCLVLEVDNDKDENPDIEMM